MHDQLHLQHHRDRLAEAERAHRHRWPHPPRPPGAGRRALAAVLRAAADALAPIDLRAAGSGPRRGW